MSNGLQQLPSRSCADWERAAYELLAVIETLHEAEAKPTDETLARAREIMVGKYQLGAWFGE